MKPDYEAYIRDIFYLFREAAAEAQRNFTGLREHHSAAVFAEEIRADALL